MKKNIHPNYYEKTIVRCACGNSFTVGSTKPEISVEICSNCHPFYTGEEKLIDAAGRVEKFRTRLSVAGARSGEAKARLRVAETGSSEANARRAKAESAAHKPAAKKEKVSKSKKK